MIKQLEVLGPSGPSLHLQALWMMVMVNESMLWGKEHICFGLSSVVFSPVPFRIGECQLNHPALHKRRCDQQQELCFLVVEFSKKSVVSYSIGVHVMGKHICFVLSSVVFSPAPFRMVLGSPSRTV